MNIILTRKGYGSVRFTQMGVGEAVDVTVSDGVTFCTTPDGANELYRQYIAKGFARKAIAEPKVHAPKAPKVSKPKVSREEALTAKYGDKESRRQYVEAKKKMRRAVLAMGYDYGKKFDGMVKTNMEAWEAFGRPEFDYDSNGVLFHTAK